MGLLYKPCTCECGGLWGGGGGGGGGRTGEGVGGGVKLNKVYTE